MNPPDDWLKTGCGAGSERGNHKYTHGSWILSVLYHVFARKRWILCSALRRKSCLTLPYVTWLWDSFCLGTFAHGFIRLLPRSLTSLRGCSLAIMTSSLKIANFSRLHCLKIPRGKPRSRVRILIYQTKAIDPQIVCCTLFCERFEAGQESFHS